MSEAVTVTNDRHQVRVALAEITRTLSISAIAGAMGGIFVAGVLGRLAMRLLAVTSPSAQGRITDDKAVVGQITLAGTANLALFGAIAGVVGGLIYPWVRRVLPETRRGRIIGYGLFTGAVGGALFVHDHPSFDYTMLTPAWLAVGMFIALPLIFGSLVAALVETVDHDGGIGRRLGWVVLLAIALAVALPTLLLTFPLIGVALAVVSVPTLRRAWRSRAVTLTGEAVYAGIILWGLYCIVVDVISIATDQPSSAPFNP
jgi:hypothetical protein